MRRALIFGFAFLALLVVMSFAVGWYVGKTKKVARTATADTFDIEVVDGVMMRPIPGATVRTGDGRACREKGKGLYSVPRGRSSNVITVRAEGYAAASRRVEEKEGVMPYIALTRYGDILVCVTDANGVPQRDVSVWLDKPDKGRKRTKDEAGSQATATDADGLAGFHGVLPDETHTIAVQGAPTLIEGIKVAPGYKETVEVNLPARATILGRIRDWEGKPGGGFQISCRHRTLQAWEAEGRFVSQPDGFFMLPRVLSGSKRLEFARIVGARAEGFSLELDLAPGAEHDCGEVGPGALGPNAVSVLGKVVDQGGSVVAQAAMNASVHKERGGDHFFEADFKSDANGRFELRGLPPHELFVSAARREAGGRQSFVSRYIPLAGAKVHEIELKLVPPEKLPPGGYIEVEWEVPEGRSIDRSTHGIDVLVRDQQGRWLDLNREGRNDDGSRAAIRLSRPAPGTYEVIVVGQGYVGRSESCEVRDGETTRCVVKLKDAFRMRGRVIDAATRQGISAQVSRAFLGTGGTRKYLGEAAVVSDDVGVFEAALVAPGEPGTLVISAKRHTPKEIAVDGRTADLGDIALEPQAK